MAGAEDVLKLICSDNVVDKSKGNADPFANIDDDGEIGIYFSAHWCPPCRGFTPVLAEYYNKQKTAAPRKLEIVFVSSDRDQASFDEYFAEMPWLAVNFDKKEAIGKLGQQYEVRGIPTLVLIKKDGTLITKDGRSKVASAMQ